MSHFFANTESGFSENRNGLFFLPYVHSHMLGGKKFYGKE